MKTKPGLFDSIYTKLRTVFILIPVGVLTCHAQNLGLTYSTSFQTAINVSHSNPTFVGNTLQADIQIQNTSGTWIYVEQSTVATPKIPVALPYTVYLLGPGATKT